MNNGFITIDEVSDYLKLKKQKLYKLAQKGKIPAYKFGREWRFRENRLEQWIEAQETGPRKKRR